MFTKSPAKPADESEKRVLAERESRNKSVGLTQQKRRGILMESDNHQKAEWKSTGI
jgi:hypothetical protein